MNSTTSRKLRKEEKRFSGYANRVYPTSSYLINKLMDSRISFPGSLSSGESIVRVLILFERIDRSNDSPIKGISAINFQNIFGVSYIQWISWLVDLNILIRVSKAKFTVNPQHTGNEKEVLVTIKGNEVMEIEKFKQTKAIEPKEVKSETKNKIVLTKLSNQSVSFLVEENTITIIIK